MMSYSGIDFVSSTLAPLKGIPSVGRSGFRSGGLSAFGSSLSSRSITRPLAGHKEGGIKLLDINEQPIGYGLGGKKRKRPPGKS